MNWSKRNKFITLLALAFLVIGYTSYRYVYQPHTTVDQLPKMYSGAANEFISYVQNLNTDSENGSVLLRGNITAIENSNVTLEGNIFCQLQSSSADAAHQIGHQVIVKGRYIGYDDLLEEVKIDQASIIDTLIK